jgi:hypothetical protein
LFWPTKIENKHSFNKKSITAIFFAMPKMWHLGWISKASFPLCGLEHVEFFILHTVLWSLGEKTKETTTLDFRGKGGDPAAC